jgi:hypothetical protein
MDLGGGRKKVDRMKFSLFIDRYRLDWQIINHSNFLRQSKYLKFNQNYKDL